MIRKLIFIGAISAALFGCPQAAPLVAPSAECVAAVLADALQGMTVAEILAATASDQNCKLAFQDVVNILLGSTATGVQDTKAYAEALTIKPMLNGGQ